MALCPSLISASNDRSERITRVVKNLPAIKDSAPMQANLFDEEDNPAFYIEHELTDATIREFPQAFAPHQCDKILNSLLQDTPWQQDSLWIAGKQIAVPRLQCWMGDRGSHYGYSGIRLVPVQWSGEVAAIREHVQQLTDRVFNSVLLNYYRDGQDSVAWHADDEAELGPGPIIASVSFGAERPFQLRHKLRTDLQNFKIQLRNGSLLLMGNTLQDKWLHQLPKVKGLTEPRISLTFRTIRDS